MNIFRRTFWIIHGSWSMNREQSNTFLKILLSKTLPPAEEQDCGFVFIFCFCQIINSLRTDLKYPLSWELSIEFRTKWTWEVIWHEHCLHFTTEIHRLRPKAQGGLGAQMTFRGQGWHLMLRNHCYDILGSCHHRQLTLSVIGGSPLWANCFSFERFLQYMLFEMRTLEC